MEANEHIQTEWEARAKLSDQISSNQRSPRARGDDQRSEDKRGDQPEGPAKMS